MADRLLLESGSPDGYLLEDGSGVLLMQVPADDAPDVFVRVGTTANIAAPLFTPSVHPTGQAVTASLGAPTLAISSATAPTGQSVTVSLGTPTASAPTDHTETPSGYGLTTSLGTPVVAVVALPSGFGLTASQTAPTEQASSSVSPTGFGLTASQTAPVEAVTALPAGQGLTASLGTVTETVSSSVSPTGLAGTTGLGTPSATGGSIVSPTGLGLTAALGTPTLAFPVQSVAPAGLEATMGLGTPTVSGAAEAPPAPVQGEPIGTRWQRRPLRTPRVIQEPEPEPVVVDAVVRVAGFGLRSRLGTTWQVADAAIAPHGLQVHAQSTPAKASGMHNPTDAQIVQWLIDALTASV